MLGRILNKMRTMFRNNTFVLALWAIVCISSMVVSSVMVKGLREKETYYISLWSYAMGRLGVFDDNDPLIMEVIKHNTIPFVITNERLQVEYYHLVPDAIIDHPTRLRNLIDDYSSINNTIIIFDRCRENVKPFKGQKDIPYASIGDQSVRDNMRRSVFTTLTTLVTVAFLAIFGSDTIREFCVPIILGLVAGFYSSVVLATPIWVGLSKEFDKISAKRQGDNKVNFTTKEEDDEDATVYRGEAKKEYWGEEQVVAAPKAEKKAQKPAIHKYSKKNTTFKKK